MVSWCLCSIYILDSMCIFQEGETSVHYAAGLSKQLAHDDFEDTDIIRLLLEFNGDTSIPTKMVQLV